MDSKNPTTVAAMAALVHGRVVGDENLQINGAQSLASAGSTQLAFVDGPKKLDAARRSQAGAIVCQDGLDGLGATTIVVDQPRVAFAAILREFFFSRPKPQGIHPQAIIAECAHIGSNPDISPLVCVGKRSKIGNNVRLSPGVVIGEDCVLGEDVTIHANVSIRSGSQLGNRVEIHDGTIIGGDGFGYVQNQGRNEKVPQLGIVVIEDDVEIGSNTTVDRAAFGETRICKGAKIDNLVQVAHNVQIGSNTIIISQVGISGSTTIGSHCMIGGQVGIVGHITITDQVMIGAQSGVARNVDKKGTISGSPALDHMTALRAQAIMPRLPVMKKELKDLAREIEALKQKIDNL